MLTEGRATTTNIDNGIPQMKKKQILSNLV